MPSPSVWLGFFGGKRPACIGGKENWIQEKALKDLSAAGIIRLGKDQVQIVFGTQSELLRDEIMRL